MKPILLDPTSEFETERLTIRFYRPGDGALAQAAYVEGGEHVHQWVGWADPKLTLEEAEEQIRKGYAAFLTHERFPFFFFLKGSSTLVGMTALHHIDWDVPKFEIGYLVLPRFEGQGYCGEVVRWITHLAFDCLSARRVEIRTNHHNERSYRVAERAGFQFEGVLSNYWRSTQGELIDIRMYSKTRPDGETKAD